MKNFMTTKIINCMTLFFYVSAMGLFIAFFPIPADAACMGQLTSFANVRGSYVECVYICKDTGQTKKIMIDTKEKKSCDKQNYFMD